MHKLQCRSPAGAALTTAAAILVLSGCGGSGEVAEEVRDESYAEVKVMVEDFANLYAENKERAREELSGLAETLAGYAENPIGDQQETMQALHESAASLQSNFDDEAAVTQMTELAETLPGDAAAFRTQMEEGRD